MAVTNEQISAFLASNPGMSDATIAAAMAQHGVTPAQMAQVTGIDTGVVQSRFEAAAPAPAPAPAPIYTPEPVYAPEPVYTPAPPPAPAPAPLSTPVQVQPAPLSSVQPNVSSTPSPLGGASEPLYSGLTAASTPQQIAEAYDQFISASGGNTTANQDAARTFLESRGIVAPTIEQAYNLLFPAPASADTVTGALPEATSPVVPDAGGAANSWDYGKYLSDLKTGSSDVNELKSLLDPLATQNATLAGNAKSIFDEILEQQKAGTSEYWSSGNFGTLQSAALDTALRLAETGVSSLKDIGVRKVERLMPGGEGEDYLAVEDEYFNKATGEKLQDWDRLSQGNTSGGKINYRLAFTDDGQAIPYTTPKQSDWMEFREDTLKPAFATFGQFIPGVGPYIAAANAANAASKGDWGSAVVSALSAVPGFNSVLNFSPETLSTLNTAKTTAQVLNAIEKENPIALANALMQTGAGKDLIQQDMGGGITMGDVLNTAKIVKLAGDGNYAEALSTVGEMTNSSNLKVAASAVNFGEAIRSGDPFRIGNAVMQLDNSIKGSDTTTQTGDLGNRVYDDAIVQAGADAFIRAKDAGASDEDAMAAADAASGVVINKIPDSEPSNVVTTTYGQGDVDTNFGDLEGAIATNAINDATRVQRLDEISNQPKFADAYSQARSLLGPNQTFTWQGKEYSTATAQERPDLSAPRVQPATDESAAETARLAAQNRELGVANAPDQSAAETARLAGQNAYLKSMEKTGFLGQIYKDLNEQFRLQGVAANEYLKNNPNSPITESVSSAFEAAGELQKNLGGIPLALDNKPLADAIIKSGSALQTLGQSLGSAPQDTKNWNDTLELLSKASGTEKLAVLAGRIMDGTSGLSRQIGLELRQELPALFLGGGLLRPTMIASGLIDTADTGGGAVVDAYDDVIKNGGTHQEGLSAGRKAGAAAAATEAAIQLTLGKIADFGVGKLDNIISKGTTKVAGEGTIEGLQEAGSSAAVDLALGNAIDVNKALTQGIVGAAVGKGTAATTTPVDVATTPGFAGNAATETAVTNISNNISTAISSGDIQSVGPVITESVTSSINSGANSTAVVDSAISTAITGGADPVVVVDNTITSAINAGAPVDTTIGSAVSSAVNAGADVNVVIDAATKAANSTGNNVTIASDANMVTINNATTNTGTTVDTTTGSTTTVNNATNETTIVDPASNTTTQVTFDGDTQTTVINDQANNTQTVIKTDTNTGEVLEQSETQVPPAESTTAVQQAAPDQAALEGIVADQVGSLDSKLSDAIAEAKASGLEGDKVLQSAIDKVSSDLGVTQESLLSKIEETGSGLRSEIEKGLSGVSAEFKSSYDALNSEQKALADDLASQGLDLKTAISVAQEQTEQKIDTLESKFSDAIKSAENAGLDRDQAIQTAVDSVAKDLSMTRSDVISQLGLTESTLRSELEAGIGGLESQMKDQYSSLTAEQKTLSDALTNQGIDLKSAIDTAQKQTQEQLQDVTTDFETKYNNLSTQQKILADSLIEQGVNVNQAINTSQSVLQGQISKVSADVESQYNELSSGQKDLADDLVKQGVELKDAIELIKESLEKSFTERQNALEKAMRLQGGQSQAVGTVGPATTLGLTAASLASKETQKSIDPLARVKEAQAELEREAMMNQIDPRLMSVMQQRMDPQQQTKQFDSDIGALARMLGGDAEAPANEGKYYSYGSEDSIDDILGGRAANYAAGGYVEPLKASGGSMALPLLAKSGGALGHYKGRENFKEGKHVAGDGDGQSDDIPAWLADGEFVFPADVVSALGNGSTKAGTDKLYEMMHGIRDRARSKGPKDLPPPALKSPLDYLKSSKRSTK